MHFTHYKFVFYLSDAYGGSIKLLSVSGYELVFPYHYKLLYAGQCLAC